MIASDSRRLITQPATRRRGVVRRWTRCVLAREDGSVPGGPIATRRRAREIAAFFRSTAALDERPTLSATSEVRREPSMPRVGVHTALYYDRDRTTAITSQWAISTYDMAISVCYSFVQCGSYTLLRLKKREIICSTTFRGATIGFGTAQQPASA